MLIEFESVSNWLEIQNDFLFKTFLFCVSQ